VRVQKGIAIILTVLILSPCFYGSYNFITYSKAASFDEINHPDVFLKQVNGDMQCTLVAATMLIRRAAILTGNPNWKDITVDKVKVQAWVDGIGLKYTFTYAGITVNKAKFANDPVNESIALLQQHPEGIVLYHQNRKPRAHAILLTDYTDGIFYCADPSDAVPYGRIPVSLGLVQVENADSYYYISSPSIPSYIYPYTNEDTISENNNANDKSVYNENSAVSENIEKNNNGVSIDTNLYDENTISPVTDISSYEAQLSRAIFYYDGNVKKPTVKIPGLTENIDYTVSYINNIYPGTATVVIVGTGNYSGYIIKNFEIRQATVYDYFNDINVAVSKSSIKVGKTAKIELSLPDALTAVKDFSIEEQNAVYEVKISYSSSNSKIAKVNSNGKITGKKKGTVKIKVTAELADGTKKEFTFKIKVK